MMEVVTIIIITEEAVVATVVEVDRTITEAEDVDNETIDLTMTP